MKYVDNLITTQQRLGTQIEIPESPWPFIRTFGNPWMSHNSHEQDNDDHRGMDTEH